MSLGVLILLAALALAILPGIRVVPDAQRFVVFRLGRIHSVLEPGIRLILPGLDRTLRVDLNRALPDWQSLPEPELQDQVRQLVLSGQVPTSI
jgi:regulator of protease activity HflC (stomatin/prohibitin superfamily)